MNIDLQKLTKEKGITTKEISERLEIGLRTAQNYVNGSQTIPDPIQKLIRHEFREYLSENERLVATPMDDATSVKFDSKKVKEEMQAGIEKLQEENKHLKQRVEELEQDKKDLKHDKEMLQLHIETLTGKKGNNKQTA